MTELIDLSHTVESGMITYKGLPAPVICDYLSREASRKLYAQGTEFSIGRMEMVGNTGTYLDSPFHRYADGKDLSQLPLTSLANLDCVIAHIEPGRSRGIDRSFAIGLQKPERSAESFSHPPGSFAERIARYPPKWSCGCRGVTRACRSSIRNDSLP